MSSKKRLLLVRRKSGGTGGAEAVAEDFSKRFGKDWDVKRVFAGADVDGFRLGGDCGPGWWRALHFANRVNRLIKASKPDAVLSLERGPNCSVYRAGDGVHKRWIQLKYGRSLKWILNPLNWAYLMLEQKTVYAADVLVANSEMVAHDLRRTYPDCALKIHLIRNGFDPNRFYLDESSKAEISGVPNGSRCLAFLGSGWDRKGLSQAIKFFSVLCQISNDFKLTGRLLVAGVGKEENYKRMAFSLGVGECVHFLGAISTPEDILQRCELMILPTLYDPFSNATLEALACGCPVLTTSFNGALEVVDIGRTGLVFHDPVQAAKDFIRTNFLDRAKVAASVKEYTRNRELACFHELLLSIISKKIQ